MKPLLPHRYQADASAMRRKLLDRIITYAMERRHVPRWKKRLYGLMYGAGMMKLSRMS